MSNPDYHSDLKAGPKKPGIALKNLEMICRFDSFQKKWGFDILETTLDLAK